MISRFQVAVAALMLLVTPAAAQSLQALPFDKQLQLAKVGDVDAQYLIGLAYQSGRGTEADPGKAAEWYRKAADLKLADAENNLGMLYLQGKGVARDLAEAFKLFERAATQNDPWGLNNLGGMYEMGWGTTANRDKALDLYRQALAAGNGSAQQNVDRLTNTKAAASPPR